jgi:hypothetical protein
MGIGEWTPLEPITRAQLEPKIQFARDGTSPGLAGSRSHPLLGHRASR